MTIVTSLTEAPNLKGEKTIILDFESTSRNQKLSGVNPWHHCWIGGTGVTTPDAADNGIGWYLPTGHLNGDSKDGLENRCAENLDEYTTAAYLYDILQNADTLIGSNIKFDCHLLVNNWEKYFPFRAAINNLKLVDTVTHAKLVDSDRFSYGLKKLAVDWLGLPDHSDPLEPYLKTAGGKQFNQDYGQIPIDVCGPYCVEDLITTWRLEQYCREKMNPVSDTIWDIEQKLTSILYIIEATGMRIDLQRLYIMSMGIEQKLVRLQEHIHELLVKEKCSTQYIRPAENDDCYQVVCAHYGLPVLSWTEGGKGGKNKKPSFDKHALRAYLCHPVVLANDNLLEIIKSIQDFRKWNTINNMFIKPYKELHVDGLLHGDFNQMIRTGRMAMRRPNMQQVPWDVRLLIVPWDQSEDFRKQYVHTSRDGTKTTGATAGGAISDEVIVSRDASQVEFRLIVNYCRNRKALDAYRNNPATDYHQLMADLCRIDRKPAKNINFMLSYGGGKYKCLSMLKDALDLLGNYGPAEQALYENQILRIEEVKFKDKVIQPEMELTGFDAFCYVRATKVYDTYHRQMPELKKITWKAQELIQQRGYIINLYGRVRHLPAWQGRKAFNSLIQSSASDLIKERTVASFEYLQSEGLVWEGVGPADGKIKMCDLVHDEVVESEPRSIFENEQYRAERIRILENPERMVNKLDVPILWDTEYGEKCWAYPKE